MKYSNNVLHGYIATKCQYVSSTVHTVLMLLILIAAWTWSVHSELSIIYQLLLFCNHLFFLVLLEITGNWEALTTHGYWLL